MLSVSKLNTIFCNEGNTVQFMQEHDLLPSDGEIAPCKRCHGETKIYYRTKTLKSKQKRKIPTVRCVVRGCQTYHSIREYNKFFTSFGSNNRCSSNLKLGAILQMLLCWCSGYTVESTISSTKRSHDTVAHWFNMCRKVCVVLFDKRAPMGGPGVRIQVDEILLKNENNLRGPDDAAADEPSTATATAAVPRISGPWIFCLRLEEDAISEQRFFFVKQHDRATLISIIEREILPGTTILSDNWVSSCTRLQSLGYNCSALDRPEFITDPDTGMSSSAVKAFYPDLKMKTIRQTYSTHRTTLQSQLAEAWYRSTVDKSDNSFIIFLRHIKNIYRE